MSNSTIKLKSSATAGNTPSSLETGEFAINVADGNLFYGSASAVKQDLVLETLTVKGSLTAENYIVSSSVTHMTQSFSSGSTIFGDSMDDTHQFTGSIDITGSIVASSGDIRTDKLLLTNAGSISDMAISTAQDTSTGIYFPALSNISLQAAGGTVELNVNPTGLYSTGRFSLTGNITASGDISASGTITAGDLDVAGQLSINGFNDVSASLAAAVAGGDDLGNHTATIDLNMGGNAITNVGNVDGVDVSTLNSSFNTLEGKTLISGSAQIASDISGSFTAASASFSTRVTANDAKLTANTSNVTSAGALMDSEVTNLAQVKAFDSSDYATAAQGAKADTAIQPSQTSSFSTATGVENNADVTDTANVTAAGALMDSEVTNLAQVKAFDSSDYATAAQGAKADTAIQPSQTSSFSTATGVEDNADVTDTANVTSAGALMDSELSEIATVKALTAAGISGSFTAASASFSTRVTANDVKLTANTSNVQSAGALMDSEVTNLAQVKAFDSSDYATAAQGAKADTAIQPADTGSFSTATGVEDNADVTDTANVTAAGALMDSELTEIATVKSLTAAGISGSFTAASASFSTRVTANDAKLTANTSNVQSAGALMDSEVTNLAQVKAFDSSDYATAAQGALADSAQQPPSEGAFANGDKTKLDGIEASADVTDTANVTAAGALMDSEVTNLAQVKAFDSSDYATAAQGAKADTAIQPADTASFAITGSDVSFGHLSSSHFQVGDLDRPFKVTGGNSFAASRPTIEGIGGYLNVDSGLNITGEYKLSFDNDVTNTYIKANSDNPEDLEIHADQDIILAPDNAVDIQGILSLPGFSDVSASLAAAVAGGDNLGNHTATTNLNLNDNSIHSALHITASGNISSSGKVTSNTLDVDSFVSLGGVNSIVNNSGTIVFGTNTNAVQIRSLEPVSVPAITTANITASSNISASGFVSASEFIGDGSGLTNVSATLPSGVVSGSAQIADVTLTTAAQTNITSLGSLTALDVNGNAEITGSLKINPASATDNEVLFEILVGGDRRVFIDEDGDAGFDGSISCNTLTVSSDGSQSSPAIKFGSDINTGIWQPADNQIALQANGGTTELTISTSGVEVTNGNLIAPKIKLSKTSATDGNHDGDVVFFGGTTSMSTGKIYYYNASGGWTIANADALADSKGLLAVALGTASDTNGMLIKGMVTLDHDPGSVADVLYLSTTDGEASSTAPSGNNHVVRILGYCLDASDGQIYFNPSNDFIVITA